MANKFIETVGEISRALESVQPVTPFQRNAYLSEKYDADIWLKREDLGVVRSYKIRGAFNAMRKAIARGDVGAGAATSQVVTASAGNHAQGVAYACRHFGLKGIIYMPVATPEQKVLKTRTFGGDAIEIRLVGDYFDETQKEARAFAKARGALYLAPFDDPDVVEGQATIMAEILETVPEFDEVFIPVGGGGVSAGTVRYLQASELNPRIHFVEPEGAASLKKSLEVGEASPLPRVDNFVDGAAVAQIGSYNFSCLQHFTADHVIPVPENRLCQTMIEMLNIEGIVLEPAGALAIDALRDVDIRGKRVVVIVSGGNFDFERLPDVKERAMRYEGTKKYLILRLPQRPGALRDFLDTLGPDDDIARFEYIKKSARQFGSVLIGIETKNPDNFAPLFSRLDDLGFVYQDVTEDDAVGAFLI